ncbi:MAG: MaoC family dehydratase [Acidimicrobiales bacterium]
MPTIIENPAALIDNVGLELGPTDWLTIAQDRIDLFAEATGDHQWIHVDPVRAADGPFGAPIAHGYLTLSLASNFLPELIEVRNMSMGINYGVNKARFPSPVPVGSRIRARGEVVQVDDLGEGAVQAVTKVIIEIEGSEKPAAVIETVSRYVGL